MISSLQVTGSITCSYQHSEVQVDSSEVGAKKSIDDEGVAETPEEEQETEDEDPDQTITAVEATQAMSQQPHATPQLSHQRSIVVQETPTIGTRTYGLNTYTTLTDIDPTEHTEAEPYSTARTGHSQTGLQDEDMVRAPCANVCESRQALTSYVQLIGRNGVNS